MIGVIDKKSPKGGSFGPLFFIVWLSFHSILPSPAETFQPDPKVIAEVAEKTGCGFEETLAKGIGSEFSDPETCAACHPRQYREWLGSSHSYGAISPTFNTFEMVAERATDGRFANNGQQRNFCNKCHSPTAEIMGEFQDYTSDEAVRPMRESLSEVSRHGVSCESCHRVRELDTRTVLEEGKLGDGMANTSLLYDTQSGMRRGPIEDPVQNGFHSVSPVAYDFMTTDGLCAGCHDVRIGYSTDILTGDPFFRLENLVSEFHAGPYYDLNHPRRPELEAKHPRLAGRIANCQDCHMSLYPVGEVGEYPTNYAAEPGTGDQPIPLREVSTHYFTGVDIALIDFPNQINDSTDEYGMPKGLAQRRRLLLQKAVELSLEGTPDKIVRGGTFPLSVTLTNVGAGHNVVAGFSQERQIWIEAIVTDANGTEVFNTGFLRRYNPATDQFEVDPDGDGEHDEDWANAGLAYPPDDSGGTPVAPSVEVVGPDAHLVAYNNHFEYVDDEGTHHETFLPFPPTNHFNNGRTLKPFEPVTAVYDIPIPEDAAAPLSLSVRVRFRHFPPIFLRYLKDREGSLVTEETIDRLEIIDMAAEEKSVGIEPNLDLNGDGVVDIEDLLVFQTQWMQPGNK